MTTTSQSYDDGTAEHVAAILDAIGELAIERRWTREHVAVAMAKGAGDIARANSADAAELDRAIGALEAMMFHAADDGSSARWPGAGGGAAH
jgi:hypothetical protein